MDIFHNNRNTMSHSLGMRVTDYQDYYDSKDKPWPHASTVQCHEAFMEQTVIIIWSWFWIPTPTPSPESGALWLCEWLRVGDSTRESGPDRDRRSPRARGSRQSQRLCVWMRPLRESDSDPPWARDAPGVPCTGCPGRLELNFRSFQFLFRLKTFLFFMIPIAKNIKLVSR